MRFLDRLRRTRRVEEVRVRAGTELLIGAPADPPPEELVARLRARCLEHPEVGAAYLFQMMILQEREQPHLALGLVLAGAPSPQRVREVADDLGEHAYPLRPGDDFLAIQVLDEEALASVADAVAPLFVRG